MAKLKLMLFPLLLCSYYAHLTSMVATLPSENITHKPAQKPYFPLFPSRDKKQELAKTIVVPPTITSQAGQFSISIPGWSSAGTYKPGITGINYSSFIKPVGVGSGLFFGLLQTQNVLREHRKGSDWATACSVGLSQPIAPADITRRLAIGATIVTAKKALGLMPIETNIVNNLLMLSGLLKPSPIALASTRTLLGFAAIQLGIECATYFPSKPEKIPSRYPVKV